MIFWQFLGIILNRASKSLKFHRILEMKRNETKSDLISENWFKLFKDCNFSLEIKGLQ